MLATLMLSALLGVLLGIPTWFLGVLVICAAAVVLLGKDLKIAVLIICVVLAFLLFG